MTITCPTIEASAADRQQNLVITEFTPGSADLDWYVVNDNVMGGRSSGGFNMGQETLRFTGHTNTTGGGFSSIRTKAVQLNLSKFIGIRIRVRGDGRRYTWRLTTDARWRGREVGYWADFETARDEWRDVAIPFSDFVPQVRGYRLDGPALEPGRITGMGLMIYDKEDGPFALNLDSVSAYGTE